MIAEIDDDGFIKNDGSIKPVGKSIPMYIEETNPETYALIKKKGALTGKEKNKLKRKFSIF